MTVSFEAGRLLFDDFCFFPLPVEWIATMS